MKSIQFCWHVQFISAKNKTSNTEGFVMLFSANNSNLAVVGKSTGMLLWEPALKWYFQTFQSHGMHEAMKWTKHKIFYSTHYCNGHLFELYCAVLQYVTIPFHISLHCTIYTVLCCLWTLFLFLAKTQSKASSMLGTCTPKRLL